VTAALDPYAAFRALPDDPDWRNKSLIGAVLSLVPVLNFAVIGYETRLARQVWHGEADPLPRLDDIGGLFTDGLWLALARIVLMLPVLALVTIPALGFVFLPIVLAALASAADADRLYSTFFGVGLLGMGLSCGAAILLGLVLSFLYPAMTAAYVRQPTFAACFNFREIARFIRENTSPYLMAWLAQIGAGLAFGFALSLVYSVPCIGWALGLPAQAWGVFYLMTFQGHLVGQLLSLDEAQRPVVVAASAA
jgi:Protein of unknown function (DUF4013)